MIQKESVYVSDYILEKLSALEGVEYEFDGVAVSEVTDMSLVMAAIPKGTLANVESAIKKSCGLLIPEIQKSSESPDSSITFWRLQNNQVLVFFAYEGNDAESYLKSKLNAPVYLTDQSDTWAMIRVKGPRSRDILERICPINIDKDVFTVGSVSRTVMEHIGTIIYRDEDDSYILLTMRSFGRSMIHAIEVSAGNVL
jgi:sarcosine oxidase subunit gamma